MRRFELVEGKSSKFWEIDRRGSSFTVTFGRIGTNGQTQTKSFDSDDKAEREHDKLVSEKVKKGYVEVGAATNSAPAKPAEKPAPEPVAKPPAASPPPKPPAPIRGDIAWTPALLSLVAPSAHSTLVVAELPTAAAAWKKLLKPLSERLAVVKDDNTPTLSQRVREAYGSETPPTEADPVLHGAAWALLATPSWNAPSLEALFAAFLTRAFGLLPMLEAFTSLPGARVSYNERALAPKLGPQVLPELTHDVWRGLRRCWLASSEADRAAAMPRVREWLESHPHGDTRLALAVMVEDDAVAQVVTHQTSAPVFALHLSSAAAVTAPNLEEAKQRLTHGAEWDYRSNGALIELSLDLLLRFGVATESLLIDALTAAQRLPHGGAEVFKTLGERLALIDSERTAQFMASQLGFKDLRPIASAYVSQHPSTSIAPVAEVAAGRGAAAETARSLLQSFLSTDPELTKKTLAEAPSAVKAVLEELTEANDVVDASDEQLPVVLRDVPWKRKTRAVQAEVVEVHVEPEESTLEESLREHLAAAARTWVRDNPNAAAELKKVASGEKVGGFGGRSSSSLFLQAPAQQAIEVFNIADLSNFGWSYYPTACSLLHRFGVEVVPGLINLASVAIVDAVNALYYVNGSAPAPVMATALVKSKKQRANAQAWLLRQPRAAVLGLLPVALGPLGADRSAAEEALRFLAKQGQRAVVEAVAEEAAVLEPTRAVLDFDPLLLLPKKLPALPAFYLPGAFTRPRLADRKSAFPLSTLETFGTMLAMSTLEAPYVGVQQVKDVADPKSLARFSWELFQAWIANGAPSKEGWALTQLGLLGDDEVARQLTPLIRAWPGEAAHARAVTGLDVLARIGTDVALMHLHGIAQKLKFKGLQEKAREKIDQIAEQRGFTADELADRLVPDLGLDDDGTLWLDFGPRKFKVVFDETLKPFVLADGAGKPGELPKARQSDDATKAEEATATWKALKKDAKTIAEGQVRRLELAMCAQRRWPREVFEQFLLGHPLLIHLVRRLVWGVYGDDGALTGTFRVAEDRSLADAEDEVFTLPAEATLGVAHRLELDDATAGQWGQVFADYEILQPFEQLARSAHSLSDAKATELETVKGLEVPTGKVLGLDARGWRRGTPQDGGVVGWYEKPVSAGTVFLELDPGIFTGIISEAPKQTLGKLTLSKDDNWYRKEDALAFGTLSAVEASELLRDLDTLKES